MQLFLVDEEIKVDQAKHRSAFTSVFTENWLEYIRLKWLFPCCYLIRDVYRGHFSGQRFYTSMCMIGELKSSKYRQLYLRAIHGQVVWSNCRKSLPARIKRRWRRFGHLQVNRFNAFKSITSKSTLLISIFC